MVREPTVAERGPGMRVNPLSGAMYVRGERKLDVKMQDMKEQDYYATLRVKIIIKVNMFNFKWWHFEKKEQLDAE